MSAEQSVDDSSADPMRLSPTATADDLEHDQPYVATINGIVDYGVFVDLNDSISGLVHESNLEGTYSVGDELVVELDRVRENGDVSFLGRPDLEVPPAPEGPDPTTATATTLPDLVGDEVELAGRVIQIKQTSGPTLFHLTTGDGLVTAAAFDGAGVRAFPEVDLDDVVELQGEVQLYDGGLQLEVEELTILEGEAREDASAAIEDRLDEAATPPEIEPLVEWDALGTLWPELEEVARELREAALTGQPVRIRHHADVDGICASVPIQLAVQSFVREMHTGEDDPEYLTRRLPSKAPFYEMADATRDLDRALEEQDRHGQRLPVVVMLDNGSTAEDAPALKTLVNYGLSVITIDHHFPDPEVVDDHLIHHVNPYLVGEDYRVTSAMLAVEVARMIDPDLTEEIQQLPAIAGMADRSEADAMSEYISLADADRAWLSDITEAVDYAAHWLRYDTGQHLMEDLLDVNAAETSRHEEIVSLFAERAEAEIERQLEAALPHLETESLPNGAQLHTLDLEAYAHRHIYPAPGKTTTALHDHQVAESPDQPTITIGYGDDYAILRSDGVKLDIPDIVTELTESIRGGGVSGGGHLVVGSIRFVGGRREEVLDALIERLGSAELDETATTESPASDQSGPSV